MKPRLFYLLSGQIIQSNADISINQGAVLLVLDKKNGSSLSALKDEIKINKSSIGALVERMLKAKLIRKESDNKDSRISRVFLTAKGKAKLGKIKAMLEKQNSLLTKGFSKEEIRIVTRFLEATIDKTLTRT